MRRFWLLPLLCVLFTVVACKKQGARVRPVMVYDTGIIAHDEEPVLENEFLQLRFLPHTAEIVLTDKATGAQ